MLTQINALLDFLRTLIGFSGPATVISTSKGLFDLVGPSRFTAPYINISEPSKFAVIATSSFDNCATNSSAKTLFARRYEIREMNNFKINGLNHILLKINH